MRFEWPTPVAAAAFAWHENLWIVFDQLDRAQLLGLGGRARALEWIEQVRDPDATILRLRLRQGLSATMRRERSVWILEARREPGPPKRTITLVRQPKAEDGARVFLPVIDTGAGVSLTDPDTGELLHAVPVLPSGHGVPRTRQFAEFTILNTIQGVAVRPKLDGIAVTALRNGVTVTKTGGLALSKVMRSRGGSMPGELGEPLLLLSEWRDGPEDDFQASRRALRLAVARAPAAGRNAARWARARFLFAHGMIPETLALLTLIERDEETASTDPVFRIVRGAANLLMRHHDTAEKDLMLTDLSRYPDAALWQAALHARVGRAKKANELFAEFGAMAALLPDDWRARLLLDWGDYAVWGHMLRRR